MEEENIGEYGIKIEELRKQIDGAYEKAKPALVTLVITKQVTVKDENLAMIFNYMPALSKKQEVTQHKAPSNPFLNPQKQLLITQLGTTHRLLFNKFNIYEKHLLVVTKEFQKQTDMISLEDMLYSAHACEALDGVLFFNGGQLSGASQPHKHLQILPHQAQSLPILSAIMQHVEKLQQSHQIRKFPDFHFLHGLIPIKLSNLESMGEELYKAYLRLHQELITKNKSRNSHIRDYNIVACKRFILMALREQQKAFGKISVNSVGFMGSLLFKDQSLLQQFIYKSPSQILKDICIKQM